MQPEWWALLVGAAPAFVYVVNFLVRLLAVYWNGKAEDLLDAGAVRQARTWKKLAALAANFQLGRRLSTRPPPASAVGPTIPAPARVPQEYRDGSLPIVVGTGHTPLPSVLPREDGTTYADPGAVTAAETPESRRDRGQR